MTPSRPLSRSRRLRPLALAALAPLALLSACGGGGGSDDAGTGTLRVALTDAPACGFDAVNVTVQEVSVHQSANAGEAEGGWQRVTLATPQRIDLLSLTNGVLAELGQTELPAGRYTQVRLKLAEATSGAQPAHSVVLTGGGEVALDTPSAMQSGLKLNANLDVEEGKVADLVLDFDACKSVVRRGNSGRFNLKPVISVLPRVTDAGLRVVGYVAPALANANTQVTLQLNGVPVRATPPDATGRFILSPVPAGTYDLVVQANGRATATVTGVPVNTAAPTQVNPASAPIDPPASTMRNIGGLVQMTGVSPIDATVQLSKAYAGGPTVEVAAKPVDGDHGTFAFSVPAAAPVKAPYVLNATTVTFTADTATPTGRYTLQAKSGTAVKTQVVDVSSSDATNIAISLP